MNNNGNDKKMPQGNQNQQKPGAKPDFDQKKPQADRGIGQEHNGGVNRDKQSSVKPDAGKEGGAKPQSSRGLDDDELDQEGNVDDEDDRITQRSPSRGAEPQRQK